MSEWQVKSLGELAQFAKGRKMPTSEHELEGYRPYLGAASLVGKAEGYADPTGALLAEEHDVLMLWDGERSGLTSTGLSGVVSSTVMRLRPRPGITGQYLALLLDNKFDWIQAQRTGTGVPHVPKDLTRLLRLPIAVGEQHQFRTCEVVGALDAEIIHTKALIAKQERVRAGLMQDLFTRGVDESGRLRPPREEAPELYHETDLGWLPKGWEAVRVRNIAHVVRGSTPRPAKDARFFDGNFVPWITVGELSREDLPYLEATSTRLTELGAKFSRLLFSGTLVISNSGYGCGVPKILKISGCANDGIAALLNLSNSFEPLFLYYFFYHNIDMLRMRVARGNDQPNLNTDIIGEIWVPRPPNHEQKSIADRVWGVQQTMRRNREATEKLHRLRAALLRDLLTPPAGAATVSRIAAE